MKIILTDLDLRKSFDVFHILKSKGYEIIGFSCENRFTRAVLSLIYGQKIFSLTKDDDFHLGITKVLKEEQAIYFPLEEDTTLCFYQALKSKKLPNIISLLPDEETFHLARDKKHFSQFCLNNNLPVPMEYDYNSLIEHKDLPSNLIIKPKIGSGSMGIKFIDTYDELLNNKDLDYEKFLIQERLENSRDIRGAFFLFDKGKQISYYGHKRIRTYPDEGGVTVYSKCEMNDTLKELGTNLLEKLQWSGVAMVEFLYDTSTKSYKIIEVNPRAWGSIMLSEFCGSKMLDNYINASLEKELIPQDINEETYIRWFFPWDLLSYIQRKGDIKDFWKFDTKKCCYINFSYAPWYAGIAYTLFNLLNPQKIKKFFQKVF